MIISANRLSSINGKVSIGINENYGSEDLGRILMEDAKNDMAIFNAAAIQDMHEIQARMEGTMLESEIRALSEGAMHDFFKKLIDKLKAFWAKMKSWFKTAIANISAYIVRDGSAFVKMHQRDINLLKDDDKCGTRWHIKKKISDLKIPTIPSVDKNTIEAKPDQSVSDIKTELYKSSLTEYNEGDSFFDKAKETYFEELTDATVKDMGGAYEMSSFLKDAKKSISDIKNTEKQGDKATKDLIKKLEKEANEAKKELKDKNEDDSAKDKEAKYFSNLSSAYTDTVATVCKTKIKLIKFYMAQCRKALATAIGYHARDKAKKINDSTLLQSVLREVDEEIEQLSDNEYASDLTPAEEKAVEELVDAIEEKLEDNDSGSDSDDDFDD